MTNVEVQIIFIISRIISRLYYCRLTVVYAAVKHEIYRLILIWTFAARTGTPPYLEMKDTKDLLDENRQQNWQYRTPQLPLLYNDLISILANLDPLSIERKFKLYIG